MEAILTFDVGTTAIKTCLFNRELKCLAIRTDAAVAAVDIKALQNKLEKENVMIHFPDEYVPEDRTVVIHGKNAAEIEGGHF